jgi:hypothetical protein
MKGRAPRPDAIVATSVEEFKEENKKRLAQLVVELWAAYESESDANAECLRFIRWHRLKGLPHAEIAVLKYGEPRTPRERKQHQDRIAQKICRNHRDIKKKFEQLYGVTSLREVARKLWNSSIDTPKLN